MSSRQAIVADRVWTAGSGVLERAMVLTEGAEIVAVDAAAKAPADVAVVDLGDATLLPGLIDAHVHLCFDASPDVFTPMMELDDESLLVAMREHAHLNLMAGVTTVRDLGDRRFLSLEMRDRFQSQPSAGPELLVSGPPITRRGGHCWFLGGEADTVGELEAEVNLRAERGCDVVKVMATGGVITPGFLPHESQFGVEELRAIVAASHNAGLPVAAHAHGPDGIRDAVAAGVDSVEHCTFFTADGIDVDWGTVEEIVRRGIFSSATIATVPGAIPPPPIAARIDAMAAAFQRMHEMGARIVCTSDAGVGPPKPHGVLPHGGRAMSELGLSNAAVLESMTSVAAAACGLSDRKGRLAPGFDADIIAVGGNPLDDVGALLHVAAVFRAGERVR